MVISRVPYETVQAAAQEVGLYVWRKTPRPPTYLLRPAGRRWRTDDGRVCSHGYAAFIRTVLEREPGGAVRTAIAEYRGLDDFLEKAERDGARAAEMFPDSCHCLDVYV